jgi:hypothetical protein
MCGLVNRIEGEVVLKRLRINVLAYRGPFHHRMSFERSADGAQIPDPTKFPDGFKAVADFIHNLGMKSGLSVSPPSRSPHLQAPSTPSLMDTLSPHICSHLYFYPMCKTTYTHTM